jgi:histidyl-tRNA synthetase
MSDITGDALLRREQLQRRLTALLSSYGYCGLDTPLLEPTELFLRKSGGELASQLFSFTDPGGRAVSLRPEFTAPAMRYYLEHAAEIELPARWQYCGPVFRFDGASPRPVSDKPGNSGQFTQIGGELVGASSVTADVELLNLAVSALAVTGLRQWTLQLADLNILNSLLDPLGLSERARAFVVQSVPLLRDGRAAIPHLMDDAQRLHVIGRHAVGDDYLSQAVHGLDDDDARNVLLGVLRSNPLDQLGQRRPEEVVERLLRKIRRPDVEESLRLALQFACELAQVRGDAATALDGASGALRKAGADTSAAGRLEQIVRMMSGQDDEFGRIVLDFGLVRGLAYYNGIIFEVSHPDWAGPLGGGGRYDGLARDLGGSHRLPALGFAFNLDALVRLTSQQSSDSGSPPNSVLVMADSEAGHVAALSVAQELRDKGEIAELEVTGRTVEESCVYAALRRLGRVVVVRESGETVTYEV